MAYQSSSPAMQLTTESTTAKKRPKDSIACLATPSLSVGGTPLPSSTSLPEHKTPKKKEKGKTKKKYATQNPSHHLGFFIQPLQVSHPVGRLEDGKKLANRWGENMGKMNTKP